MLCFLMIAGWKNLICIEQKTPLNKSEKLTKNVYRIFSLLSRFFKPIIHPK